MKAAKDKRQGEGSSITLRNVPPSVYSSNVLNSRAERPKCPSVGGCINKIWHTHIKESYSAVKRIKSYYNLDEYWKHCAM
jgi:hypothetical protein